MGGKFVLATGFSALVATATPLFADEKKGSEIVVPDVKTEVIISAKDAAAVLLNQTGFAPVQIASLSKEAAPLGEDSTSVVQAIKTEVRDATTSDKDLLDTSDIPYSNEDFLAEVERIILEALGIPESLVVEPDEVLKLSEDQLGTAEYVKLTLIPELKEILSTATGDTRDDAIDSVKDLIEETFAEHDMEDTFDTLSENGNLKLLLNRFPIAGEVIAGVDKETVRQQARQNLAKFLETGDETGIDPMMLKLYKKAKSLKIEIASLREEHEKLKASIAASKASQEASKASIAKSAERIKEMQGIIQAVNSAMGINS